MWVQDRGVDNDILKKYFINNAPQFIIRLMKTSKFLYKGEEIKIDKFAKKVKFTHKQTVVKTKKNKKVRRTYELGIVEVEYVDGQLKHPLYVMVTKNQRGGLAYFLVKSNKINKYDVLLQAFKGYGLRWSIEEYHRHIKQEYGLEKIQMRKFAGLQSVLAVLTVAMNMIYHEMKSLHFNLLLDSGINLLNKNSVCELTNFIYYKISKIVSDLLKGTKIRFKIDYDSSIYDFSSQLQLEI